MDVHVELFYSRSRLSDCADAALAHSAYLDWVQHTLVVPAHPLAQLIVRPFLQHFKSFAVFLSQLRFKVLGFAVLL